jgi:hypothetical protein
MRKLIGLLALALVAPVCQPTPAPSATLQASQPATKEPESLTRAKAYIENTSEAQSIEKTKQSVLKIRNCLQFQTTLDAIKSEASYKQFEWPGFYEFRNPSDKAIVLTDFRITTKPNLFEEKQVRVMTRSKPDRIEAFGNLDDMNAPQESGTAKSVPIHFPIAIPPHGTRYLKIHVVLDVSAPDKTLEFQDETEANKWVSAAIGLQQNPNGHFRCAATGFPIEVSTADHKTLKYEPFTALIVPGCEMVIPPRPQ